MAAYMYQNFLWIPTGGFDVSLLMIGPPSPPHLGEAGPGLVLGTEVQVVPNQTIGYNSHLIAHQSKSHTNHIYSYWWHMEFMDRFGVSLPFIGYKEMIEIPSFVRSKLNTCLGVGGSLYIEVKVKHVWGIPVWWGLMYYWEWLHVTTPVNFVGSEWTMFEIWTEKRSSVRLVSSKQLSFGLGINTTRLGPQNPLHPWYSHISFLYTLQICHYGWRQHNSEN